MLLTIDVGTLDFVSSLTSDVGRRGTRVRSTGERGVEREQWSERMGDAYIVGEIGLWDIGSPYICGGRLLALCTIRLAL
jgi:hypothetical protein